ncbi:hypothetical protein SASPL_143045 [Salvia splendens]|uniref:Uncharacterized protein n=1 Tax=Salvia splendens TaxID=180675 RepID=A0A8X8ZA06_SALSN|nr:hypothetical protein SASPL_143045 [Salvia splendens]
MVATSACINGGLDSQSSPSGVVDTSSLALEHILASIACLEARVYASKRRATTTPQPPRPDPDPPCPDWQRGRDAVMRNRAVVTAATGVYSHPQLGFGGGMPIRGPHQATLAVASPWEHAIWTSSVNVGQYMEPIGGCGVF